MDNTDERVLRYREYMGWACIGSYPLQRHLDMALAHFRKRHGRLPSVVALHGRRDGAVAPKGVALVEAPRLVREGNIHLYF